MPQRESAPTMIATEDEVILGPYEESGRISQKPVYAAIFLAGAGVLDMFTAIIILDTKAPVTDVPINLSGFILFCGVLVFLLSLAGFAGAFVAYEKGSLTLVLVATIAVMLGVGPFYLAFLFGLVALILIALSTEQFQRA